LVEGLARLAAVSAGGAILALPGAASALPTECTAAADHSSVACKWTSGTATFSVPAGLALLHPTLVGGSGGATCNADGSLSAKGGEGAYLTNGNLTVAPGDKLDIVVGGNGGSPAGNVIGDNCVSSTSHPGFNGGGAGSTSCPSGVPAGGGGGRSEIDLEVAPLGRLIAVAGGGGGAGCKGKPPTNGQGDLSAPGLGGDAGVLNTASISDDAVDGEGSNSCPTYGGGAKFDSGSNTGSFGAAGMAHPGNGQPCTTGYTYGSDGTAGGTNGLAGTGEFNFNGGRGGAGTVGQDGVTTSGGGGGGGGGWYSGGGGAGGPVEQLVPAHSLIGDTGYGGGGGGGGSSYADPGIPGTGLYRAAFSQDGTDNTATPYVEIDYDTLAFNLTLPRAGACGTPYYYNYSVVDASNTQPTLSESGTLPPGLAFDPSQQTITGTPNQSGTWTFTVSADAGGAATPISRDDTITVTDPSDVCTPQPEPKPGPAGSVPGSYGTGPTANYFFPSDSGGLGSDFGTVGPASGGSSGSATGAGAPAIPTKTGRGGVIYITLPVACQGPAPCSATITARVTLVYKGRRLVAVEASRSNRTHRSVIVGRVSFTVPGGTQQTVPLALNRAGHSLLKTHRWIPVRLIITRRTKTIGAVLVKITAPQQR
jgi:hypothetical protein